MSDEDIIKRKLLLEGAGTAEQHQIDNLIKQIAQCFDYKGKNLEELNRLFDKAFANLHCVQLNRRKFDLSMQMLVKERAQLENLKEEYNEQIETIRKDIEEQRRLLKLAAVAKNRHSKEKLATVQLLDMPTQAEIENKLSKLKKELTELRGCLLKTAEDLKRMVRQSRQVSAAFNIRKNYLLE